VQKAFAAAQATLIGIELMHMIKQQLMAPQREEGHTAAEQFYALASSLKEEILDHRLKV
jgi:hypothetical protein